MTEWMSTVGAAALAERAMVPPLLSEALWAGQAVDSGRSRIPKQAAPHALHSDQSSTGGKAVGGGAGFIIHDSRYTFQHRQPHVWKVAGASVRTRARKGIGTEDAIGSGAGGISAASPTESVGNGALARNGRSQGSSLDPSRGFSYSIRGVSDSQWGIPAAPGRSVLQTSGGCLVLPPFFSL
jgi:hypothetical protein